VRVGEPLRRMQGTVFGSADVDELIFMLSDEPGVM
jgi:hypothetical protein